MKKTFVLFLAIVCTSILCMAQIGAEHMKFKKVPINGSLITFIQKMKTKGFVMYGKNDAQTLALMNGKFAEENVTISIFSSKKSRTVYSVHVNLKETTAWAALKAQFDSFKEMLTTKYGEPSESYEEFEYPYKDGNGLELNALKNKKANFSAIYDVGEIGIIRLDIFSDDAIRGQVVISYYDLVNFDLMRKEKSEIISDDL